MNVDRLGLGGQTGAQVVGGGQAFKSESELIVERIQGVFRAGLRTPARRARDGREAGESSTSRRRRPTTHLDEEVDAEALCPCQIQNEGAALFSVLPADVSSVVGCLAGGVQR